MRILRFIAVALLVLTTAACSTYHREFDANLPFEPHYYRSLDLEVTWQSEQAGQDLRLLGTVTNRRYAFLRDLELTVRILDKKGDTLAKETVDTFPVYVPPGKSASFKMNFKLPQGAVPTRLHLNYLYFLREEPPIFRGDGALDEAPHFGSFDASL